LKFDIVVAIFSNLVTNDYKSHVVVNGLVTFWLISTSVTIVHIPEDVIPRGDAGVSPRRIQHLLRGDTDISLGSYPYKHYFRGDEVMELSTWGLLLF
jgi:hypothetical protein